MKPIEELRERIRHAIDDHANGLLPSELETLLPLVLAELDRLEAQLAEVTAERDAASKKLAEYVAFHADYERAATAELDRLRDRLASALGWVNLAANLLRPEENR